jgi:WD40 repeat protein
MIVLEGHEGTVTALAYSPDGRTLATGGSDGRVKLWDPFSGRELRPCARLRTHPGPVGSLSFGGGGKWLAAGFHGDAIVWSVASGQMLHWHRQSSEGTFLPDPTLVSFHPRDERLALALGSGPVVEVEPLGDRRLRSLTTPISQYAHYAWNQGFAWRSLLLTPAGVLGGSNDHVYFWREGQENNPRALHWPNGSFVALAADASGRWIAGARGRGVALWDLHHLGESPKKARTFKAGDRVNAVALTPDGRTLLGGGDDWTVHVWDVPSGQKRTDYNWRLGQVAALVTSPDGMTAAVGGRKGPQVLIWDLE